MTDDSDFENDKIAIVGMAGRFPGANSIDALWQLLTEGREGSQEFSIDAVDAFDRKTAQESPNYVRKRGALENIEDFDAGFFGLRPLEAKVMDPQQRVFLEICYEAMESAGCIPERFGGSVGVFATASQNTYRERCLTGNPSLNQSAGEVAIRIGNELDYLASSVAYRLNLNGPAVTLRTACSSSLVAIANGCRVLMDYECDAVLAGGVSITVPQSSGYVHQPGGILSPDGHCRTFDKRAQGTYFSNGAAVVLLKRLEDAVADGDDIWATIIGCGVNNDGANRASFTAPNVMGQAEVVTMAQEMADVDPDTITYVEAHGTATEVGDPIEIEALTKAFERKTDRKQFCEVGSIKSNLGHLDVAAGVAGLIKVALALKHGYLPPSINFEAPNPKIDFENSPFKVVSSGHEWHQSGQPRRAGVSAFGTGGTNAHIVLEEGPATRSTKDTGADKLLLLSAHSAAALKERAADLAAVLSQESSASLADIEYTLRERRKIYPHRQFVVCSDTETGASALAKGLSKRTGAREVIEDADRLAFMFPGQGTQYPGMGLGLYEFDESYRAAADECLAILDQRLGEEFRKVLFSTDREDAAIVRSLTNTEYAQPAIFTLEYALAKMWLNRGVRPQALIGHSVGEFVAACLADVFSLEDALELVALRGQLMQAQPPGTMLSVRTGVDNLEGLLPDGISVACVNGPSLVVLSGPESDIESCMRELDSKDITCRPLHTSHAFHSSMMEPIIEPMLDALKNIEFKAPNVAIMSTVTGRWLEEADATDSQYWARHALSTVRFADGIRGLLDNNYRVFLECGSRTTLSTLARQQFSNDDGPRIAVASLGEDLDAKGERTAALRAVGDLWANGVDLETTVTRDASPGHLARLPAYPFQRERLWVDTVEPTSNSQPTATSQAPAEQAAAAPAAVATDQPRTEILADLILKVLGDTFGSDLSGTDRTITFVELGFDSLFLTQVSGTLAKETGVDITFRQMLDDYPSPAELAAYLDEVLPPEAFRPAVEQAETRVQAATPESPPIATDVDAGSTLERLLHGQLDVMRRQLEYVQSLGGATAANLDLPGFSATSTPTPAPQKASPKKPEKRKGFGPMARVNKAGADELTPQQVKFIEGLTERYVTMTAKSKQSTQDNRHWLADPRTVSGFHPLWKEMVYPIITNASLGSKLTDIDGNEMIDVTNGFGTILFGHSPDFIVDAISNQLAAGYETGPQSELAGEAAQLVTELTGHERVAFANTGSEAVLAAMRMARTCMSRDKIVVFAGSYHGIFDEVIYRGSNVGGQRRTLPAAPGIPDSALGNLLVLDYGSDESLEIIQAQAHEIAAVISEPVQGGNPTYLPTEFLRKLRRVTEENNVALIFDEVVTGFRTHPAGIQGITGIQADLATYGKVCGGGLPIGIVAGSSRFMDSLDGGQWQYGDDSRPEANMTFFAGTFMRHPLALAACTAVLRHLKNAGPGLQSALNARMDCFAERVNRVFTVAGVPMSLNHFSSFSRIEVEGDLPYAGLLYYLMRERGIHIWEGRAVILTTAHDDADLDRVVTAFEESVQLLQDVDLLPNSAGAATSSGSSQHSTAANGHEAPIVGAKLGRTAAGHPAWFVEDPDSSGEFLQIGEHLRTPGR